MHALLFSEAELIVFLWSSSNLCQAAVPLNLALLRSKVPAETLAANVSVDVTKLTSDQSRRDQRIHSQGLESDRYPTATFKLTSPIALPAAAAVLQLDAAVSEAIPQPVQPIERR